MRNALLVVAGLLVAVAIFGGCGDAAATPASACSCPACDCPCAGGDASFCKCRAGTCDCPCDHLECDGTSCRIVPGKGRRAIELPGDLRFDRGGSDPLPPAPPIKPLAGWGQGEAIDCPDPRLSGDVSKEQREWYRNLSNPGSCVQCSIGMCGVDQGVSEAATLLWDTRFGKAEHHGSYPSRVAEYARARGMRIYNVTGRFTYDWMKWACRNGRCCAIGAGTAHFQTLFGHDPKTGTWYVCNNNSPQRIDVYSDAQFRRLHEASGQWCVILDYPPGPTRSAYSAWWELN